MGTRISTTATLAAQPIHANEITECNETVGKTDSGRLVRKMPSVLQRLVNKLWTFRCFNSPTSPRTVSKVDPAADIKADPAADTKADLAVDTKADPTIDTKSKTLEQEQNNRTSDRIIAEIVGEENKALLKEIREAAVAKLNQTRTASKTDFGKASDSQSTIGQIGEPTSETGISEDDDSEYFDALEYLEDGDEFFDALEYQPNVYKQ